MGTAVLQPQAPPWPHLSRLWSLNLRLQAPSGDRQSQGVSQSEGDDGAEAAAVPKDTVLCLTHSKNMGPGHPG